MADAHWLRGVSIAFQIGVTNLAKGAVLDRWAGKPGMLNKRLTSRIRAGPSVVKTDSSEHAAARHCVLLLNSSITGVAMRGGWEDQRRFSYTFHGKRQDRPNCGAKAEATHLAIAEQCPKLEYLDASATSVTDAAVEAIAKQCPLLHTLNVSQTNLTDAGLSVALALAPQLRSLNVVGCIKLTDAGFRAMSRHAARLQELTVGSAFALAYLAERCPALEHLSLQHDAGYFETGSIHSIYSLAAVAKHCVRLHELVIGCQSLGACDHQLPGIKLRPVLSSMPQLRRLTLHCTDVLNRDLVHFAGALPHLEALALPSGRYFDDDGITEFARLCRGLRCLDITGATKVTFASLLALAAFCPRL